MAKRVALYLRVSKADGSQTTDHQLPECEELGRRMGEIAEACVYLEEASAVKVRPAFARMMADARKRRFDVLVVWALDRFGRAMVKNMTDATELARVGVQLASVREPWLDTTGPTRDLLLAIFSWCAEQERARLIERTKAGLLTARRKGKRLGRPRCRVDVERGRELMAGPEGLSQRAAARALKVSLATFQRALARTAGPMAPTAANTTTAAPAPEVEA